MLRTTLPMFPIVLLAFAASHVDAADSVWVRLRVTEPANLRYWAQVPSVGSIGAGGFYEKLDKPKDPANDLLKTGDWSAWAPVPPTARQHNSYSGTDYGFTQIMLYPPAGKPMPPGLTVALEFSTSASKDGVFHTVDREPVEAGKQVWSEEGWGVISFYVPPTTKPEDLKKLETIHEASVRRLKMIEEMKLGEPPHLSKVFVGTWMNISQNGRANREHAETDFRIAELLGVNAMTAAMDFNLGPHDADFAELAQQHGILSTSWTTWGGKEWLAAYAQQAGVKPAPPQSSPQIPAKDLAELEARWRESSEKSYADQAAEGKAAFPRSWPLFHHLNLGDEIGPSFNADNIAKDPSLLNAFRDLLRRESKCSPAELGAASWDQVMPLDDRKRVTSVESARLFYHSRRAFDALSAINYRAASDAVRKHFPQATFVGVNYQAGPAQYAFIGNTNDLNNGMMDIFDWSRRGAFHGVMTEDWVAGWDLGLGQECLAGDLMRAAGRKHDLPLSSYIVGGENAGGELFAFLMQGVKENNLYLYGPYTNIGPVWADNPDALASVGKITRLIKKVEEPIAAGHVRPSRAAMLVATTSDVMQIKGTFFCPERQFLYLALKHDGVPIDVVCEQDITEDDILKNYSLLYVTDPQVRRDVQERIASWVKDGGRLWAGPVAARWDEYNQPCEVLTPVLGLKTRDATFQDPWPPKAAVPWATKAEKITYKPMGTLKASSPMFGGDVELPVTGMKLKCAPADGAKVLGKYDDGSPAVLVNDFGKGRAMLMGTQVGQAYVIRHYAKNPGEGGFDLNAGASARRLAAALVDDARVSRPVTLSSPGLYTSVWDAPGCTLVFVLNGTGAAVPLDVTVDTPGTIAESARQGSLSAKRDGKRVAFHMVSDGPDVVIIRK